MSRIGKNPILVSDKTNVVLENNTITVKGEKGEYSFKYSPLLSVVKEQDSLVVSIDDSVVNKKLLGEARKLWGTTRAFINNMVVGVTTGFKTPLEITGVGYRASVQGSNLVLQLGYSHDIIFPIPAGITVVCPTAVSIIVEGSDKQQVGQVVARIKRFRKMDPYKGKGIKIVNEFVRRKEGKKK